MQAMSRIGPRQREQRARLAEMVTSAVTAAHDLHEAREDNGHLTGALTQVRSEFERARAEHSEVRATHGQLLSDAAAARAETSGLNERLQAEQQRGENLAASLKRVEEGAWERGRAVAELGTEARLFRERAEVLDHERKQLVDRSESLAVRLAMLEAQIARGEGKGQHS